MSGPDYLFDKKGPADPDVAELERLLGRFGHRGTDLRLRPRRRWWPLWLGLAAAAAVLVVATYALGPGKAPSPPALELTRGAGGAVALDEWFEATDAERELALADHARLTLEPGSRLQVRRLDAEQTRFYLAEGRLEAFVFPNAHPRFFQVETPATTCVDLGCRYTLDVDPATGGARVRVTMGQVAFVDRGREVFIPRGAECDAERGRGAGTPRFSDAEAEFARAIDRFDQATGTARAGAAVEVAKLARDPRDSLPLWHLLADQDAAVRRTAETALERLAGRPEGEATLERWRDHLDPHWW